DVIVTDIVMPGLNGLEVLERSRVLNPRVSVIVMTAYAALETAITALRGGACDYLEKPFSVDVLKERVQRLLQYRETIWKDGLVRGAFTTAVQANPGLFVTASHGTLFLDEIGELPLPLQVKLLRVIEDKGVLPVGGTRPVPVDARIIASTNRDLGREVEARRF